MNILKRDFPILKGHVHNIFDTKVESIDGVFTTLLSLFLVQFGTVA